MALSMEERAEVISADGFTCRGVANFGVLGADVGKAIRAEVQHMKSGATRVLCPMLKQGVCYQVSEIHRTGCPYLYCPPALI